MPAVHFPGAALTSLQRLPIGAKQDMRCLAEERMRLRMGREWRGCVGGRKRDMKERMKGESKTPPHYTSALFIGRRQNGSGFPSAVFTFTAKRKGPIFTRININTSRNAQNSSVTLARCVLL